MLWYSVLIKRSLVLMIEQEAALNSAEGLDYDSAVHTLDNASNQVLSRYKLAPERFVSVF